MGGHRQCYEMGWRASQRICELQRVVDLIFGLRIWRLEKCLLHLFGLAMGGLAQIIGGKP